MGPCVPKRNERELRSKVGFWVKCTPATVHSRHACRFKLITRLVSNCTVVKAFELSTGAEFRKRIPGLYHPHLSWIEHELTRRPSTSKWLQAVMDCFADELRQEEEFPSTWRSRSLNSLLIREFCGIPHDDPKAISRCAAGKMLLARTTLTVDQWWEFYTHVDVVGPRFHPTWAEIKPQFFKADGGGTPAEDVVENAALISEPPRPVLGTARPSYLLFSTPLTPISSP